ncbi:deoxyguanosinetriphosphate triphosphohydrolase [Saccharicrinis sp. FJH54]|uniref:deoxyguanosinetriphosphate triphosphohydrolase n=1 Tax=Saccharicrinis sp. FJH54 TaxID=3344665 RepID=UPI0035D3F307
MNWNSLLSTKRLGLEDYFRTDRQNRTEYQRDYDRIIFSASFRRLQNKTQVFPLPGRIFVHNRLTHSLEVASVGRSLGHNIAVQISDADHTVPDSVGEIGSIVAAACLVHDLGNPPFGHSGENVLSSYFTEGKGIKFKENVSAEEWSDLTNFEGNANAFRLLTHQFKGRRDGGFVLTYPTLASTIKYPWASHRSGKKKYGFFQSEALQFEKIAKELGLENPEKPGEYFRHPLVFLVEAADDICYQIMDIEDAHKLGILTTKKTKELLLSFYDPAQEEHRIERLKETMNRVTDKNEQIAYLRASVIGKLIDACSQEFMQNYTGIMSGSYQGSLIKNIKGPVGDAYRTCATLAVRKIYKAPEVVEIEIAGYRILSTLLDVFVEAALNPDKSYSKQLLPRLPEQYEITEGSIYNRIRNVLDFISGMTDIYALDLYRKITGISIPGVDKVY